MRHAARLYKEIAGCQVVNYDSENYTLLLTAGALARI
jgi:hypothetical protein